MRKVILIALLVVVSGCATPTWVRVTGNKEEGVTVFTGSLSVRRSANLAQMWELYSFHMPQTLGGGGQSYLSEKALAEYDCKHARWRGLDNSFHSGSLGDGEVIYFSDSFPGNWIPVVPGSLAETFWKLACDRSS